MHGSELLLIRRRRCLAQAILDLVPVARELAERDPLGVAFLHRLDAELGDIPGEKFHRARTDLDDLGIDIERRRLRVVFLPVRLKLGGARAVVRDQPVDLVLRDRQCAAFIARSGELSGANHEACPERDFLADEVVMRLDCRGGGRARLGEEARIGIELLVSERR